MTDTPRNSKIIEEQLSDLRIVIKSLREYGRKDMASTITLDEALLQEVQLTDELTKSYKQQLLKQIQDEQKDIGKCNSCIHYDSHDDMCQDDEEKGGFLEDIIPEIGDSILCPFWKGIYDFCDKHKEGKVLIRQEFMGCHVCLDEYGKEQDRLNEKKDG